MAGSDKGGKTRLVGVKEVMAMLGLKRSTVYNLKDKGVLPTVPIPGARVVRFREDQILALVEEWEQRETARRSRLRLTLAQHGR